MMVLKSRNKILQSVHSLMEETMVCQSICGSVYGFQCITYYCEITKVQEVFAVPEGTLIKSHVIMFPRDGTQAS